MAISVFVSGPGGSSNLYSGFRESGASISVVSRRNWSRETHATFDTPVNFGAGIARGKRNSNPNCDAHAVWKSTPDVIRISGKWKISLYDPMCSELKEGKVFTHL